MGEPVRTCLACRTRRRQPDLLRLVAEGGAVIPDPLGRRPGRGAYVCPDERCVDALGARGVTAAARALRVDAAAVRVDGGALRAALDDRMRREAKTTAEDARPRVTPAA